MDNPITDRAVTTDRQDATMEIRLIFMLADAPSETLTVQQVDATPRRWDVRRRMSRPGPPAGCRLDGERAAREI
jgi:hypothetical protein